MINLEDLIKMKEQNEESIKANDEVIAEKQAMNCDLKAENRVFDKLIKLYQPEETAHI
jgi:hypothetical protein